MDSRVLELLKNKTCVLSTCSLNGNPEAATVVFAVDASFCFYFESFPEYRKVVNLRENPKAALVIDSETLSLQLEGNVAFVDGSEAKKAEELLVLKEPLMKAFLEEHEHVILKLTPTWARLRDSAKREFVQIV